MPVSMCLLQPGGGCLSRSSEIPYPGDCRVPPARLLQPGRQIGPLRRDRLLWRHLQRFAARVCSNPSLPAASAYVRQGIFTGIRFSTRPDCLGDEVVELISKYPVRAVELGVQSLSDTVLQKSRRGYSARSVEESAKRVRDSGWALGIQMMAGLPGDTRGLFIQSMDKAIALAPDFLRIYPTLVLAGTNLADSFRKGIYTPLSLDEAVTWLTPAYAAALRAGIPVIRMGLHPDPALEKPGVILAGPYHPAFGHLVRCRWWKDRVDQEFAAFSELAGGEIVLRVSPNRVSDVIGHGRSNLRHWKARWNIGVKVMGGIGLDGIEMVVERLK